METRGYGLECRVWEDILLVVFPYSVLARFAQVPEALLLRIHPLVHRSQHEQEDKGKEGGGEQKATRNKCHFL